MRATPTTTAGKRRWSISSRDRDFCRTRKTGPRQHGTATACRATAWSRRGRRSRPRLRSVPAGCRRGPRRAAAAGAARRHRSVRRAEGARRRARLPRSAARRARPGARQRAACARGFQRRFTRIFVDEFQDTDPLQAEILLLLAADDPTRDRLATRPAASGQAVPRRRSEAVDLSLPPRRRRHLPRGLRAARSARRDGCCSLTRASAACRRSRRA